AQLAEKFAKYQNTEVIYLTSETGEFVGIENWKEIATMMKGLFADVVDVMADKANTDKKELSKTIQPLLLAYESKEGVEQLVFKELQLIHFPFGLEYTVDEVIKYEEQLPNMFGGNPIRG